MTGVSNDKSSRVKINLTFDLKRVIVYIMLDYNAASGIEYADVTPAVITHRVFRRGGH